MGRGDHIRVYRGGYYHHGIDLGNGQIIHFTGRPEDGFNKREATIRKTPLAEFSVNNEYEVVAYSPSVALHPDHVCLRALSSIGASGYHLFSNNCEHFATSCKTGKRKSGQVEESYGRIWKVSKFGIKHPGWFLAGPAVELLRRGTLYGWHWMKQLNQPEDSRAPVNVAPQDGQCTALFRSLFGYAGSDAHTYVQNFEKQWFIWDTERGVTEVKEPGVALSYTFRVWIDDNRVQYFETQAGWYIVTQGGLMQFAPYPLMGGTFRERVSTPQSAPFGALHAMIEVPGDFDEQLIAINEVAARGMGEAHTYHLLISLAGADTRQLTGQVKNSYDASRGAALVTLALMNRTQHHALPTEKLPGLAVIFQVLLNEGERDELRIVALKAVERLGRPNDPLLRGVLEKAGTFRSQAVKDAVRRLLRGEAILQG